jgi:ubiquinone biosynthesis protein
MASRPTRKLGRLSEIAQVAVRHGFGYFLTRHRLGELLPGRSRPELVDALPSQRGQHLREMLDELGPTFVKFGQLLSMRPDVLPPDVISELRALQDDVRPFAFADVERVVQEELGQPIERLFLEFEQAPMAAASIGQVHRAVLPNGRHVAVKVQRPQAPQQIEADLALLYQAARIVKERVRALDFVDTRGLVDEFARSIRHELDYRLEGRNADLLRANFATDERVRIPRVYWTYTRPRVLTLEFLDGPKIGELGEELSPADRRLLADRIATTWMEMIFRHGAFHGDPHPANILVPAAPDQIGLVDFGIVGKLSEDDMSRLTRLFIDASNENVDALPRHLRELGVRYPPQLEQELTLELRELYYRYYGASLSEIDALQVIREAFALIHQVHLKLPTRFLLLDKVLHTLAAVGVELYPEFNVFTVARPYARELVRERFRPARLVRLARRDAIELGQVTRQFPVKLHDLVDSMREGRLEIGFIHKGLEEAVHRAEVALNRLVIALVVVGGMIGSSLIGIFAKAGPHILGVNLISVLGFLVSGVLGVWLLWGVLRSGRL